MEVSKFSVLWYMKIDNRKSTSLRSRRKADRAWEHFISLLNGLEGYYGLAPSSKPWQRGCDLKPTPSVREGLGADHCRLTLHTLLSCSVEEGVIHIQLSALERRVEYKRSDLQPTPSSTSILDHWYYSHLSDSTKSQIHTPFMTHVLLFEPSHQPWTGVRELRQSCESLSTRPAPQRRAQQIFLGFDRGLFWVELSV